MIAQEPYFDYGGKLLEISNMTVDLCHSFSLCRT